MRKFKRIFSCALLVCVLLSSTMLTSCMYLALGQGEKDEYVSKSEIEEMLNNALLGDITVNGGDNYEITIEGGEKLNLTIASKSILSAVSVYCTFKTSSYSGFGQSTTTESYSAGSGVIYSLDKNTGDAYVITNHHVVYNSECNTQNKISDDIQLFLYGMENTAYSIPATYVGGSMQYDLAVLKVSASRVLMESNARAADFADSNKISVLDTAIAVGNPEGEGISATVGYVNVDSEYVKLNFTTPTGQREIEIRVMRIDTPVNSGNSGGGLYNSEGKLIGIVNAKMTDSENIGYAIPSNVVKYVTDNIIDYCGGKSAETPYRALVGITVTAGKSYSHYDTETGKIYKMEDVKIDAVNAGSVAEGKLFAGDVIRTINVDGTEYEVTRMFHVVDSMLNARVGSVVKVTVLRGEETKVIELTIPKSALTAWE